MAQKVYIVASTNDEAGYDLEEILHPFLTEDKAIEFVKKETKRIKGSISDSWNILAENDKYFYAINDYGEWFEVMTIEKDAD